MRWNVIKKRESDLCIIFAPQILSISCNNVSCNDVMIQELTKLLPNFSGVNCTQCFQHIINLCAKSVIRQFDIQEQEGDKPIDPCKHELQDLAGDIGLKEEQHAKFQMQHAHANKCSKDKDDTEGGLMRCLHCHKLNAIDYMHKSGL